MMTGIWQLFPPFNTGVEPHHIIPAFTFAILLLLHVWLNRKPLFRYFQGLGWKWVFIVLGIFGILWTGIGLPIVLSMR
jgi:hypothetical protein